MSARQTARAAAPALAWIGAAALTIFALGCATPDGSTGSGSSREYRTGSNIPVRDRSSSSNSQTYDKDSVQDALRQRPPTPPIGAKGG